MLLSAWLLLPVMASAQDSLDTNSPVLLYGLAVYDFSRSYGFTIGTSIPFHSIIKEKSQKDSKIRHFEKDEFISAESGGYRRPFAYTAIILNAGIGTRYTRSAKHFSELSFNLGALRTIYDGKVYELDPDGNIKERRLFGRTYFTTGFSYSQNWSFTTGNSNLCFIQLKPAAWVQYPYNSFLKFHFSFGAGISYRLKNRVLRNQAKSRQLL